MSGATAAQTAGSAQIAAKAAQSAADAAPDVHTPDIVVQAVDNASQADVHAAEPAADAVPVMPAGVVPVNPVPAPPVPSADVMVAMPAPADGLPEPAPAQQPVAPGPVPVPLAEVKGRNAIAEKVEKGMRQHFPGMTDETLAKWHSNLEERLTEAKAAHKVAKDRIKEVSLQPRRLRALHEWLLAECRLLAIFQGFTPAKSKPLLLAVQKRRWLKSDDSACMLGRL